MGKRSPIKWNITHYQHCTSTQDLAHEAAHEGALEGQVIQALRQSNGRGRHGHNWDAPVGNLYISFILRPDFDLQKAGQISFITACAVARALENYIDTKKQDLKLKWPNDILVNGLKTSGILLESNMKDNKLESLIVGIGVNIFNKPDLAICLNDIADEPVYVNKVRDLILHEFKVFYTLWHTNGFEPIRDFWQERAFGMGQVMVARLPNQKFSGIFDGITDDGCLVLKEKNGNKRIISAADVYFET